MDKERYTRQLLFEPWGDTGQKILETASVFIAGAGGLGSPAALYLTAAGVGNVHICDSDEVELSNLNRQILHDEKAINSPKVDSARNKLTALNSGVTLKTSRIRIDDGNAAGLIGDAQVVIDCLDNFNARYILNRHAVRLGIPLVHAGIMGMAGQITVISPPETPCLYCLFPDMEQPKGPIPVVGAAVGVLGALEAVETLKLLLNMGEPLKGKLLIYDGLTAAFESVAVSPNPECPVCSSG